jgi:hypothetical protein
MACVLTFFLASSLLPITSEPLDMWYLLQLLQRYIINIPTHYVWNTVYKLTVTSMATVRDCEVIFDNLNVDGSCAQLKYEYSSPKRRKMMMMMMIIIIIIIIIIMNKQN